MWLICHNGDLRNPKVDWVIDICYTVGTLNKQERKMGLWTTENQDTMKIVLKAFSDASFKNYDNYSYAAGYLETTVIEMLRYTPKRYQKGLINDFIRATQRQEEQALKKQSEKVVE
jgi:hypothetical protein